MDLDGKLDGDLCDEHPSHRKKPNLGTAARPDLIGSVPDTSPNDALYRSRAHPDAGFLACSGAVRCRPARGVGDGTLWSGRGRGCGACTVCLAARVSVKRTRRLPADRQPTTVQHQVTGKTTCEQQNSALDGSSKLLTHSNIPPHKACKPRSRIKRVAKASTRIQVTTEAEQTRHTCAKQHVPKQKTCAQQHVNEQASRRKRLTT